MNINKELRGQEEQEAVALLSTAYTLLAFAPYDNWGHEGTPAQMAAFVVKDMRDQGRLSFLFDALGITNRRKAL